MRRPRSASRGGAPPLLFILLLLAGAGALTARAHAIASTRRPPLTRGFDAAFFGAGAGHRLRRRRRSGCAPCERGVAAAREARARSRASRPCAAADARRQRAHPGTAGRLVRARALGGSFRFFSLLLLPRGALQTDTLRRPQLDEPRPVARPKPAKQQQPRARSLRRSDALPRRKAADAADAPPLAATPPPAVVEAVESPPVAQREPERAHATGFDPRQVQVLSLDKPRAFVYKNFMTAEECDHLIALAKNGLSKSGVVDAETGGSTVSNIRTSSGAFVGRGASAVVAGIEARIAAWSQVPIEHGEAIQVLKYEKSQEYRAHFDYFFHKGGMGNNRIATVLLYLSDVEEGGETVFPNTAAPAGRLGNWSSCAAKGIAVKPSKGDALLFWSMKVGGELDGGSSHAGCPVIRGVKWTGACVARGASQHHPTEIWGGRLFPFNFCVSHMVHVSSLSQPPSGCTWAP